MADRCNLIVGNPIKESSVVISLKRATIVALLSIPPLVTSFLAADQIQESIKCREVKSERDKSLSAVSELRTKALEEWNSWPPYSVGSQDRKNPNGGGRIFSSFDEYFDSRYMAEASDEMLVADRLVLNYPECFTPREVVEILEGIND